MHFHYTSFVVKMFSPEAAAVFGRLETSYAGPTLEDNWVDFGSDSPLPSIVWVFPIGGWSEQIICTNDPVA